MENGDVGGFRRMLRFIPRSWAGAEFCILTWGLDFFCGNHSNQVMKGLWRCHKGKKKKESEEVEKDWGLKRLEHNEMAKGEKGWLWTWQFLIIWNTKKKIANFLFLGLATLPSFPGTSMDWELKILYSQNPATLPIPSLLEAYGRGAGTEYCELKKHFLCVICGDN